MSSVGERMAEGTKMMSLDDFPGSVVLGTS